MNEEDVKATAGEVAAEPADGTEESWKVHLAYAENFLGSDAEYCRRNRLDPRIFRAYKKKYRRVDRRAARMPAFVKVEQAEATTSAPPASRALGLPDPRWTAEFVAALMASVRR